MIYTQYPRFSFFADDTEVLWESYRLRVLTADTRTNHTSTTAVHTAVPVSYTDMIWCSRIYRGFSYYDSMTLMFVAAVLVTWV